MTMIYKPKQEHLSLGKRRHVLKALSSAILTSACPSIAETTEREWTIMIYINGKNNLEPNALDNFHSMAAVGSSDKIGIVVEMGRPKKHRYTEADGNWSGVYRFYVKKK